MAARPLIAVVFGKFGGLSDCGAYAALHAHRSQDVSVRIIALSAEATEGVFDGVNVDVADKTEKAHVHDAFQNIDVTAIDVHSADAQSQLNQAFEGVTAVVSCNGNRQPFCSRHLELSARKITAAMKANNVKRLVQISSFGIGNVLVPNSGILRFWSCLLATLIRSGRNDLNAMEQVVTNTDLDYVLVRPVGVDPEAKPVGSWLVLSEPHVGPVDLSVSKSDVGSFMLQEAVTPTLHRTTIELCQPAGTKARQFSSAPAS